MKTKNNNNNKTFPFMQKNARSRNMQIFGIIIAIFCLIGYIVTKDTGTADLSISSTDPEITAAYAEAARTLISLPGGPESGTVLYQKYDANRSSLHITNQTDADVCVRLNDGLFNKTVISFYLRSHDSITLAVPVGYFAFHIATGKQWVDAGALFGEDTLYFTDDSEHGQECGRKAPCNYTILSGFTNCIPLSKDKF